MGSEPENRAWSTYGGRWHQVDVQYRHGPQWGQHPGWALLARLAGSGCVRPDLSWDRGAAARRCAGRCRRARSRSSSSRFSPCLSFIALVGGWVALRAGADLLKSKEVTGEIVRLRIARSEGEAPRPLRRGRRRHVERGESVVGAALSFFTGLEQGQVVTARRDTEARYVHSIEPEPA